MGVKRPSDAAAGPARALPATETSSSAETSRLFVVCGRGRQLDELRALFGACGRIRHLHLALDRSHKSRGFAFLQYEDPGDAARAIKRFDQMTLEDGHVLKVTVAKEKPNGKLKRNQHARQDADTKVSGSLGAEEEAAMDGHAPGKRQRSSPPQSIIPSPRSVAAPALPLEPVRERANDDTNEERKAKRERIAEDKQATGQRDAVPLLVPAKSLRLSVDEQLAVENTMDDMLTALDRHAAARGPNTRRLYVSYLKARTFRTDPTRSSGLPMLNGMALAAQASVSVKAEQATTDMITSSIGSVSLGGTPSGCSPRWAVGHATRASRAFTSTVTNALRSGKPMLRRRRQSTDDSDSSGEDGQEGGGSRRKRSNTTVTSPPSHEGSQAHAVPSIAAGDKVKKEPTVRYPITHGIRTPSSAVDPSALARKQCKRQSSGDVHDEAFRSVKQQVTGLGRHSTELNPQAAGSDSVDLLGVELGSLARSRLFFVSTLKFTLQELEAMFSVYGDFEWVQIVKSFGRIKTMAYIKYSQASTAAIVVQSFEGEATVGDQSPGRDDFIKLTFADPMRSVPSTPASIELKPRCDSMGSLPAGGELVELDVSPLPYERQWLLLLFDRLVPNHVLSSMVTACPGMEFVDIKLSEASGDSQGVAFVKFSTEQHAMDAAQELHKTELPVASNKFLQALVIADPGQFSAAYGHGTSDWSADGRRLGGGMADDVDIGAVEARFAHLMRSNGAEQYSSQSVADQRQVYPGQNVEPRLGGSGYIEPPSMVPMFPGGYPNGAYASTATYGVAPSAAGMGFYPAPIPVPPPQYHQSMSPPPVMYDNPPFGFNGWMESPQTLFYPQYFPMSSSSHRPDTPAAPMRTSNAHTGGTGRAEPKPDRRPPSPSSSDMSMGSGESTNGNGAPRSKLLAASVSVSSARPMDFVAVVSALRDCSGMVAFRKDAASASGDGCAFVAQFADDAQARAAVAKLDGTVCQGVKLRVGLVSVGGGARSGKWGGGASGRRKRQRVDARAKGRSDG